MTQANRFMSLLVVIGVTISCSGSGQPVSVDADRLPEDWNLAAMEQLIGNLDVIKTVENDIDFKVLRWKIEENDQPQRIESALIWALFRAGEAEDWMLAHVIRAIGSDGDPSPWSLAVWQGTPQVSHEYYDHAPNEDEVDRFLRATWWDDGATAGNRLVDSAVLEQNWASVIGSATPGPGE